MLLLYVNATSLCKDMPIGLLWLEHSWFSTQMRRLTKPALIRLCPIWRLDARYNILCNNTIQQRISDSNGCWQLCQNKFQAYHYRPLSQFSFFSSSSFSSSSLSSSSFSSFSSSFTLSAKDGRRKMAYDLCIMTIH